LSGCYGCAHRGNTRIRINPLRVCRVGIARNPAGRGRSRRATLCVFCVLIPHLFDLASVRGGSTALRVIEPPIVLV
jgi:hypothetical protein